MNSPNTKKIIRKVFYSTGSVLGRADKFKNSFVDIAKSFKAGYQLLSDEPLVFSKDNGGLRPTAQQLEGMYGYFGKIVYENIQNEKLSFVFNSGFEDLKEKADELLNGISPKKETPQEELLHVDPEREVLNIIQGKPREGDEATKIQSEDDITRLRSVVVLSRLNTPQSRLALLAQIKDPDSLIRRVIVNCISPEGGQEEAFALVKLINDPDEDVARIAIRKSSKTRNRLAFTYLISRLESANVKLRQEAINALTAMTGSDLGFNPSAAESGRRDAVLRWQQVWQDNQMNPRFLMDEEATRLIIKKKYIVKTTKNQAMDENGI